MDYAMNHTSNYRGENPHARAREQVGTAAKKKYAALKAAQGNFPKIYSFILTT